MRYLALGRDGLRQNSEMTLTADDDGKRNATDQADEPHSRITVIVDYGRGNLFGLVRALEYLGDRPLVTEDPQIVRSADRVVLPGVGAFGDAMTELRRRGLVEPLVEAGRRGIPFLGICVGCQVLLEHGDEHGRHTGLALIPGQAQRLPEGNDPKVSWRIPNVGWRSVMPSGLPSVVDHLRPADMVYFAHSYAPYVSDTRAIAAAMMFNGHEVPAAVRQRALIGVQFHPERSGPAGLSVLGRFLRMQPMPDPT